MEVKVCITLDAETLTEDQMQKISKDLGFSESSFLSESNKADFRIRFFSPLKEVGLCGHSTIASVHVLAEKNKINSRKVTLETNVGIIEVFHEEGLITMVQKEPQVVTFEHSKEKISQLLGISPDDIKNWPLQTISTGTPKLLIPINSLDTLFSIKPDLEGIREYCKRSGARGFYPFTQETKEDADFHARQFNPLAGIDEDPITGVAAGALGTYMKINSLSPKESFVIEQGNCMNMPGKIFVDVENDIKVGGYAVVSEVKTLDIKN